LMVFCCCSKICVVRSTVIAAAVIPHGDFAYDPSLVDNKGGSLELHRASVTVGQWIQSLEPDLVVLTTPHGLADKNNFLFYANTEASGFALLGPDLDNNCTTDPKPPYQVPYSTPLAPQYVNDLLVSLASTFPVNVSSLYAFGDSEPIPLRWGEIIPLSFLNRQQQPQPQQQPEQPQQPQQQPHLIILSIPTRRNTHAAPMIPELVRLGQALNEHFRRIPEKVVVVASADLAHTHLACGPYGFSETAAPFDAACGEWAGTLSADPLLVTAGSLVSKALSCGYTGLVVLHGLLETEKQSWNPELLANFHPTYYGMLVARFTRKTNDGQIDNKIGI